MPAASVCVEKRPPPKAIRGNSRPAQLRASATATIRAGSGKKPGTLMLGSHSDTVPDGGRFDGIAGVSAALEVARTLDQSKGA